MAGYHLTIVLGRLGRDPELVVGKSGTQVAKFSVAVGERVKKGDAYVEETEWYRCVCFGKTAEIATKYLHKGDEAHIQGRMRTHEYTDKDGNKKFSTELIVDRLSLVGGKKGGGEAEPSTTGLPDEDLPF